MSQGYSCLMSDEHDNSNSEESETIPNWNNSSINNNEFKDQFFTAIEQLKDKKAATREQALKTLKYAFSLVYCRSLLSNKIETIISNLCFLLKKGGNEAVVSAQILALIAITVGDDHSLISLDDESTGFETVKLLSETANRSKGNLKAHCILAMSVFHFVFSHSLALESAINSLFDKHIKSKVPGTSHKPKENTNNNQEEPIILSEDETKELLAALTSWGLLVSSAHPSTRAARLKNEELKKTFVRLFACNSVEIRTSLGENLALLYESNESKISNTEGAELLTIDEDRSKMIDIIRDLLRDTDRRVAKKDKVAQKSVFRQILSSVETGEHPEESIKIKTHKIQFNSWFQILQFTFMRDMFSSGLISHLQENTFVRNVLNINNLDLSLVPVKLSKNEKKLFLFESAAADKERSQQRSAVRRNFSQDVLTMDETDE